MYIVTGACNLLNSTLVSGNDGDGNGDDNGVYVCACVRVCVCVCTSTCVCTCVICPCVRRLRACVHVSSVHVLRRVLYLVFLCPLPVNEAIIDNVDAYEQLNNFKHF